MADNTYMSRGGRFSVRTPAPSNTYGKLDDRSPAVGRAEIIEERVAMPVMVNADRAMRPGIAVLSPQPRTEGVVTKIETIVERVYAPSATAYTDGLVTEGEIIENYATADGVQGSNRSAVPRGLFQRPTSNNSNTNSGTNDAGTNGWSKSTTGGPKDGANEWNRQATGGVANSTGASAWTRTTGGTFGSSEPTKQTGVGAKDISTNDWSSPTAGGINKMVTSDGGITGWSKPIDSVNTDVGPNRLSGPGGGITTDGTPNRFSNPSSGAGAGGTDIGTKNWSRPIDGVTNDIGPNGRRGLPDGTTNRVPTNESRPTDGTNSTGTTPLRGSSSSARPFDGNNTGNDGRNWSSGVGTGAGAGAGGTDNSTNGWNRPIDGITSDVGTNGRKGPIGGTTNGININESRPTDEVNSTGTIPWRGSSVGANNSSPSALIRPMGGTNNTGNDGRNWSSSGVPGAGGTDTGANSWNRSIDGTTNDIGANGRRVLNGGTTLIKESRPADGANSTLTIPWRGPSAGANNIGTRPIVGANNTDAGAWSKPIVGTSITGKDGRSGQTGGTNDTGADWRRGPSVMTIPQQKIDGSLDKNVTPLNPSSRITPTIVTQDEYRPTRMGWASPPNYNMSTSRPTISPAAVVDTVTVQPRAIQVPWARQGQFSPSSVVPAKEPTIIDSNEAARKYKGIATVGPFPRNRVIDSLQAAQKYKGVIIPSPPRRSDQGPAVGRAEIPDEHVAMPVSVTGGVVTKIETIVERVYRTSATAYSDGFTTNGEVIESYATIEGVQGSNRSALPRGPFPRQTLNNGASARTMPAGSALGASEPSRQIGGGANDIGTNGWSGSTGGGINKSGTGDAGATGSSKPIAGGNKDVGPNQLSRPGGGITKDVTPNRLSTPSGGRGGGAGAAGTDTGTNSWSRPIDGVTDDIGPNGRRGLNGGTTNGVPTNESRPTDVINSTGSSNLKSNSGSGAWKPIGGANNTGNDGRNESSGGGPGAGGGTDTSTNNWSRPIDGSTDNIGPSGRKGLTGGTTNGLPTNESRPTDVINSTGTSTQNRPSAGGNNSGFGTWIKPTAGTNNTGNDGRSWPSGGGGDGTDAGTNGWNGPIDGTANDVGPNGMKGLIGGTAYGIPINESRPSIGTIPSRGSSVGANNISARPVVGVNNSVTGAWVNPIVGTNNSGNERSGLTGVTNYIGADWTSRPSVMIADEYRLNRPAWGQPPTNDISTRRPTIYPGVAVEPSKAPQTQVPLAWGGRFPPSLVTPTTEPKTIDSNEAAKKYNGIGITAPRPQRKKFIDSHEAAEKYKGVFISGQK
ncbi:hypothetical protein AAC387_Pa10g1732 [Persea americana]